MTLLYHDPRFLDHVTGRHVEHPRRLIAIDEELGRRRLYERCRRVNGEMAALARLERAHTARYIDDVRRIADRGGGQLDADTVVSRQSFNVARLAAGAACDAVARLLQGEDQRALCLVRPPGHHALSSEAMGFCLFSNVAVAAHMALAEFDLERVLIVDWDVHHGNGTQAAFYTDPRVAVFSMHRWPFWPGSGDVDETGAGAGLGTTFNLPVRFGASRSDCLARFNAVLSAAAERIKPQLVLVSAGFDAHHNDPIGSLGLETEDFVSMTKAVLEVAEVHAGGRLVSVLEGGYNPTDLANNVAAHLETLLEGDR